MLFIHYYFSLEVYSDQQINKFQERTMRIEKDALGEMNLPDDAYYGIQSLRCAENHNVTDHTFRELRQIQTALAEIKMACAAANYRIGALSQEKAEAIIHACEEMRRGNFADQFPINIWRSHGTGANMNANEVLANRANELLTGHKGYDTVHPNTHVNMCQSSNDVYPTVQSIVFYRMIGDVLDSVELLENSLGRRALEFKDAVRLGRTCLQDAVPNTFGQVFGGWQHMIWRLRVRLQDFREGCRSVPLGATVLGTGMGQMPGYGEAVMKELSSVLGWQVYWPVWDKEVIEDSAVFDSMQNCDETMVLAGLLKALCCAAARISKDLCIYASGPDHGFNEIFLQPYEGRRPSFIPELMIELMQRSVAFDQVATLTVNENDGDEAINDSASFVNAMELLESMKNAFALFSVHCIDTLRINESHAKENAEMSTSLATMVSALFGYEIGTKIAHKAWEEGISCKEAALKEGLLSPEVADELFDPLKLTNRHELKIGRAHV